MNPALAMIYGQLLAHPWLLEAGAHEALLETLEHASDYSAGILEELLKQRERASAMSIADGVAEIPINGPLLRAPGILERVLLGATDTGAVSAKVSQAMLSPEVRSILLTIDSPGGAITGIPELAAQVRDAAKKKPVVAFTDGMMGSAAYWIGSQASTIVASTSANVGSIGVFFPWKDSSKAGEAAGIKTGVVKNTGGTYKGMGYPGTSYTEEQMAHLQARADELFAMFSRDVKSGRKRIQPEAMRGQAFFGESARAAGLVDRVSSHIDAWGEAHRRAHGGSNSPAVAYASPASEYDELKARLDESKSPVERGQIVARIKELRASLTV
ncbi:S49 family peptidase [Horticoccus sp. 23ND18S-11]|uniref:S49 family peptidase n=1 Tax=Horticoccus sp. 23ND18S-11 TaxID=3391832 RepID=UPI0039C9B5AE